MGFDGRCDAIFLTKDAAFTPPSEPEALTKFRRTQLGLPAEIPPSKEYDLVVIGGGYSGMGAAISAARQGLKWRCCRTARCLAEMVFRARFRYGRWAVRNAAYSAPR